MLQLSQERNESVRVASLCVHVFSAVEKWLVINTSDTPGLPYTFDSRVFWGLVTFSSPLSTFLSAESTWKTLFFEFSILTPAPSLVFVLCAHTLFK